MQRKQQQFIFSLIHLIILYVCFTLLILCSCWAAVKFPVDIIYADSSGTGSYQILAISPACKAIFPAILQRLKMLRVWQQKETLFVAFFPISAVFTSSCKCFSLSWGFKGGFESQHYEKLAVGFTKKKKRLSHLTI